MYSCTDITDIMLQLAGILLILSAMRVQTKGGVFEELLHAYVSTSSWTLVGVGVLVFLFSVFGYYATLKNNYWLLILVPIHFDYLEGCVLFPF